MTPRAHSIALRVLTPLLTSWMLALGTARCTAPPPRVCDPGRVVRCPCTGAPSLEGTQRCRDDGAGYEACLGCGATDARVDDASFDGALVPDAPIDLDVQREPDVRDDRDRGTDARDGDAIAPPDAPRTGACVYPTLNGTMTPTSGRCEGNAAVTCNRDTGALTADPCDATERCVEFDVEQIDLSGPRDTIPGHRYRWAACVPRDARSCSYAYTSSDGWHATGGFFRCADATHEVRCEMPLPPLPMFPYNAGTRMGFERTLTCTGSDRCRADRCVVGDAPCTEHREWCDGNDHVYCDAGQFAQRSPCGDEHVCRSGCGLTSGTWCAPREYVSSPALCEFSTRGLGCGATGGILFCATACFTDGTRCRCSQTEEPCLATTSCTEIGSGSSRSYECLPSGYSCTAGDRCEGQTAVRCDAEGRPEVFDCGAQGMQCARVGGRVGCVAGTDVCCVAGTLGCNRGPRCASSTAITGCCESSGVAYVGTRTVPCIPDRHFQYTCPTFSGVPPYTCRDAICRNS